MSLASPLAEALRDRYVLERELGQGGMATVYLARDLKHARFVALKVLRPELAQTLGPERFHREIETVARLQHPHILPVHDSGETAGQLWFTMPFVEGESLRDRLQREQQLPVDVALRIATEAARALQYAHEHGVIHRDVKPENLLLTKDGSALVADFGIARALGAVGGDRITETGISVGTPAYMSPEQGAGDRHFDARGCLPTPVRHDEPSSTRWHSLRGCRTSNWPSGATLRRCVVTRRKPELITRQASKSTPGTRGSSSTWVGWR